MMKRKTMADLIRWKSEKEHKALVLLGARQVGKTYLVRDFGKHHFDDVLELNFEFDRDAFAVFSDYLNYEDLLFKLTSIAMRKSIRMQPGKTLLFLDEIQACPDAVAALKLLADKGDFDVVASGSMLGVTLHNITSYPVGYVHELTLHPMDFEEFLWANGVDESVTETLREHSMNGTAIDEYTHLICSQFVRYYVTVGGMPEAVAVFVAKNDIASVCGVHRDILTAYRKDIAKYAPNNDVKIKILACFDSIPEQLSKDNKKFQYKIVKQGGNARYFDASIDWLTATGIAVKCHRLDSLQPILRYGMNPAIYKLYLLDVGLLTSMYGAAIQSHVLTGDLGTMNGALYEQFMAQSLHARGKPLYYFEEGSSLEIDFVTEGSNTAVPIEVKSGNNAKSQSLKSYIAKHRPERAIKVSMNNLNCQNPVIKCYPLYLSHLIP